MRAGRFIALILNYACIQFILAQDGFVAKIRLENGFDHVTRDIYSLDDGNFVGIGYSISKFDGSNQFDLNVCGIDQKGQLQWVKTYGNGQMEFVIDATCVRTGFKSNNGILYAGAVRNDTSTLDFGTLINFDFKGDIQWQKYYYDANLHLIPQKVSQATDGGFLISGYLQDLGIAQPAFVIKTDALGNELWRKRLDKAAPNISDAKAIIQDSVTKKIILLGYQTIGNMQDYKWYDNLLILDSLGNEIYRDNRYIYPGTYTDIIQTTDKRFVAVGYMNDAGHLTRFSPFIYKFDINNPGKPIWERASFRGFKIVNFFDCVSELEDGSILVAGSWDSLSDVGGSKYINNLTRLIKFNSITGDIAWYKCYDYAGADSTHNFQRCNSLSAFSNGGWILSLETQNAGNDPFVYVRYDSTGCDQSVYHCKTVGFQDKLTQSDLRLYPNPASDRVRLVCALRCKVSIVDVNGNRVVSLDLVSGTEDINVSTLARGLYFLTVATESRLRVTTKLLILK